MRTFIEKLHGVFVVLKKKICHITGFCVCYLRVLLRDVLFGELGQLHHLRDDLFLVIAVGAIDQGAGDSI